jgi:DnaK suppressor protein
MHKEPFISEMKRVLEEEKAKLETTLSKIAKKNSPSGTDAEFPNYGEDEDENAMEVAEYDSNLNLEHELDKALRDVNSALERIKNGTYGIDKYTGELIDENRLRARPTSTTSVESKKTLTQEL